MNPPPRSVGTDGTDFRPSPHVAAALEALEAAVRQADPEEVPHLVGALEKVKAVLWARLVTPTQEMGSNGDRLLSIEETATRTGMSKDWLYRHKAVLPFTRRIGRKVLFSEAGLNRWMASRSR